MNPEELRRTEMTFELTQLEDLRYICELALGHFETDEYWLRRIRLYRDLFKAQIAQLELPTNGQKWRFSQM